MKLGGSIITKKSESKPVLDSKNLTRIASEIASSLKKKPFRLVLVHGAGSFGHPIVKKYKLVDGIKSEKQILPLAQNQVLMNELNVLVCNALLEKGVPAFPFQYSSATVSRKGVITGMNINLLERMLKLGLVPVLVGTPSIDSVQGCSIISGDQMISYLSSRLNAKKVIFATNTKGIYDSNPDTHKDAKLMRAITRRELAELKAEGSSDIDVTGGMGGKVSHILAMHNLKCQVLSGAIAGNVKNALLGNEKLGTLITL